MGDSKTGLGPLIQFKKMGYSIRGKIKPKRI